MRAYHILVHAVVLTVLVTSGTAQAVSTTRVSVDSAGGEGNNYSRFASISADGRYVNFRSLAGNLVPGDTNARYDIFVHDRDTHQTTRVSVDSAGGQANDHSSLNRISTDGRSVAPKRPDRAPGWGTVRSVKRNRRAGNWR